VDTWLVVWLVVVLVTTVALVVFVAGLARHALVVGRSAQRMQEEVKPLAEEIAHGSARAGDRVGSLQIPGGQRS
jgi:hypothetical protein